VVEAALDYSGFATQGVDAHAAVAALVKQTLCRGQDLLAGRVLIARVGHYQSLEQIDQFV
jgi:hypothetical protein